MSEDTTTSKVITNEESELKTKSTLTYINYNKDKENPILLGLEHVFGFGKYKYKRVDTIIELDPQYILWLCDEGCYKLYNEEVYKRVKRVYNKLESKKYKFPTSYSAKTKLY